MREAIYAYKRGKRVYARKNGRLLYVHYYVADGHVYEIPRGRGHPRARVCFKETPGGREVLWEEYDGAALLEAIRRENKMIFSLMPYIEDEKERMKVIEDFLDALEVPREAKDPSRLEQK
ncbi:MAG: hypothetical protein HPY90_07860 [Syntrophothermus sp.]|uniref:hypothetical protein n=1 Tax=Syntrophothermus sp. TaxID=2736299 RepID=UPI00257F9E9B|nr:hypothetical protein [Syntrophothermus sp.]NSW83176.1 hypothetical protein [Syntrophothermus sp.]